MALLRKIFSRKPKSKVSKHSKPTNNQNPAAMSEQVDELAQQTVSLTLEGDYNPETAPFEVATFALS